MAYGWFVAKFGLKVAGICLRGFFPPVVLLRKYAKRTKKVDVNAASVIAMLTTGVLVEIRSGRTNVHGTF
jgi:hypothetical protein